MTAFFNLTSVFQYLHISDCLDSVDEIEEGELQDLLGSKARRDLMVDDGDPT